MAKKTKKSAKKSPARTAARKGPAKKPAKKPARKTARKVSAGPAPVNPGRGPSPREIADAVVANLKAGRPDKEVWDRYWSNQIESVEGEGMAMAWKGRKALRAKSDWYTENNMVHSLKVEGPYVGAAGFSIKMIIDSEEKATGARRVMEEIGVYTVNRGKVVREEFMYGPSRIVGESRSEPRTVTADIDEPELIEA
jgi:hypothetical protein